MRKSDICDRAKQPQNTQTENNKNNCKLVGFVNKKARQMAFCQGRRKNWPLHFRQCLVLGQEMWFIFRHFLLNYCTELRLYKFKRHLNVDTRLLNLNQKVFTHPRLPFTFLNVSKIDDSVFLKCQWKINKKWTGHKVLYYKR